MKRVPRINYRYPLRSRGGAQGEQGALSTSHSHSTCFQNTRPKNQLEASKQQHRDVCRHLSRALANLYTNLKDVGVIIYIPHTLEPLKDLGLDIHTATKLALKLHAQFVQYAYKLSSTSRVFEKTYFNSHQQDQARGTASSPLDPH
eukprot:1161598-Pelagomonas_calceolata.AAC.9